MMRADAERGRGVLIQRLFYRQHRFPLGQTSAIADAEDMGVYGKCLRPERRVHHDIGGFAAHTGECFQRFAVCGHFSAMIADEQLG